MGKEKKDTEFNDFKSTADLTSNPGFKSTLSITSKGSLDEKPYNPFEHRNVEHPNSTTGSIVHLLKACVGTGVLAMPAAFKNAGLVAGALGTVLACLICTHTMHMLVKASQELCVDAKKPSMTYADTCGAAFTYGPKRLRSWDNFVRSFVDYCMALTYASVLCVYVVFIGSSLKETLDVYLPQYEISTQTYCALTLVPLVLICQIRNLKYLVPFSAFANGLVFIVFGITLYYIFTDLPSMEDRVLVASVTKWPLFFSTVVFAMEGIGVVMPLENEMAKPQQFLGCPGVLNISMIIVVMLFTVVGFFGYVQFGDAAKGSITLNLPQDHIMAQVAKLLMAFVIFFSYTLQFYVPMDWATRMMKKRGVVKYENITQIIVRTCLVTASVAIAAAFPNLELVISLVGAVFFSTLGLLFPAIVETIYRWDRGFGKFNYVLWKNIIIGIIALIALVSGAYTSIQGMAEEFGNHESIPNHNDNATVT